MGKPATAPSVAALSAEDSLGLMGSTIPKLTNVQHAQSLIGRQLLTNPAPDYSSWDREDAYKDIVGRYDMLNMLSANKAAELGLGSAYDTMQKEIMSVLYGDIQSLSEIPADDDTQSRLNKEMYCKRYGITSDAEYERVFKQDILSLYDTNSVQPGDDMELYVSLSKYGLTDQKSSIASVHINMLRPSARMNAEGGVPAVTYLENMNTWIDMLLEKGETDRQGYEAVKSWTEFMRNLFS